jgi:SAM-dependent methyltransferase
MLQQGFAHITTVDKYESAADIYSGLPKEKVDYIISGFEEYSFPEEQFDLVNAQRSLPFISPKDFTAVFNKVKKSLKPAGIFTGHFFGVHDTWASTKPDMTFQTKDDAVKLLDGMEIIKINETENDSATMLGKMKHWHRFDIIARKK